MRILLAVLMHHQEQYAKRIADAIAAQTVAPVETMVMLDRPDIKEIIATREAFKGVSCRITNIAAEPDYLGRPQMTPGVEQFCSGEVRNRVVRHALETQADGVVFIDGDCVPGKELIERHGEILLSDGMVATVGKRHEVKHMFKDQRETSIRRVPIFKDAPYHLTEEPYFVDSGVLWTCNFGVNRAAMLHLTELNNRLYGRPEAFSTDFTGTWGGEDGFIGLECLYTGVKVYSIPFPDAAVLHIEHQRPLDKYDHVTFVSYLDAKRIELMHLLEISGLGTNGYPIRSAAEVIGDRSWAKND